MKGKIYWVILGLVAIAVAIAVIWIGRPPAVEEFVIPEEEEIETKLTMGVGYSIKKDVKEAVLEAYEKMTEQLNGEKPLFVILTSTVGYDQKQVLAEAKQLLLETKIYGYTSLLGIMTNDGFLIGEGVEEGYVLSLTGFSTNEMVFGVGASSLDEVASPQEAGRLAISRAIQDAGKSEKDRPKIVLISTSPFGIGEDFVIEGIESVLDKEVPLVGGGAAAGYSDLVSGGSVVFANDKVYERGVVAVPIYTDLKIGHAFLAGFNPTEHKGTVTKFRRDNRGLHIVEIDGKPAARVYNEWLGGLFDRYLGASEMFLGESVNYTFGIRITEADGFINWQMIVPFHFNPDDSITVGAAIKEGTEVHLLKSNPELFIQRAALAVRLARSRGEITGKEIAGIVIDQCGGTLLGIPGGTSEWEKMISLVKEAGADTPFLGVSNLGPYGYFAGVGNRYGEVTASVLIFSKH
ncbi:MAG: FIST N-terminal domain-containing protein [Patescibacteria group bacterium]|nr:FIST N-terminal domain-containing protein [Patescibacteria group bacterium]